MAKRRFRSPRRLFGALLLLLLIAAMLPLSAFLAGLLPGGGSLPAPEPAAAEHRRAGTLRITVLRAEDLAPLAGARILVRRLQGGEADVRSDAEGSVSLDGLGEGPVHIEARHEGRRSETWADPAHEDRIRLAVPPAPRRRGVVRGADGSPTRAVVRLLDAEGRELARTECDELGRYELDDDPAAVAVCATAPGRAPAIAPDGDLRIEEGLLVEGRLEGAGAGELVVYGQVPAAAEDTNLPLRGRWPVAADGSFSGRLPEGAEAWGLFDGLPVRVRAGVLELPPTVHVVGRVLRADGSGAAHALLLFRPLLDDDFPAPMPGLPVEADADGHFEAPALPQVRYAVEVRASGCATRIFSDLAPDRDPLQLELDDGYELRGTVVDAAGLPVSRARVQAVGLPADDGTRPVAEVRADAEGCFELTGLGGRYARLRVSAPGCFPTSIERVGPGAKLRVVLQRR